ncbi:hypothetical protein GNT69_15535 [Bacillus sp. B15-48]|nr:hypothetical protein [Bacillus sp. B15-48]
MISNEQNLTYRELFLRVQKVANVLTDRLGLKKSLNVYPSEIEAVIENYEGMKEVAVIGASDEKWGEVPIAFVIAEQPVGIDDLKNWLSSRLAKFKIPKEIIQVREFPRNSAGKVQKNLLKAEYDHKSHRLGG